MHSLHRCLLSTSHVAGSVRGREQRALTELPVEETGTQKLNTSGGDMSCEGNQNRDGREEECQGVRDPYEDQGCCATYGD